MAQKLFKSDEVATIAFFPHIGTVISLVRSAADGGEVEVGVVGGEGFTEIQPLLSRSTHRTEGVVQNEGAISRVALTALREVFGADAPTRELLLLYTSVHMDQVTQNTLCNGLHSIEQRLAKWLLIMRDRSGSDELHLTHELLSHMLGIRRAGVTVAVGTLADYGLVEHTRNRILILKPAAVAERACDCYRAISGFLEGFRAHLRGDA